MARQVEARCPDEAKSGRTRRGEPVERLLPLRRQCIKQMPEMNANSSPVQYASFIESMSQNPPKIPANS